MLTSVTIRSTLAAIACAMSLSAYALADQPRQIDIQGGELFKALLQLSNQYGAELVYRPEQVHGLKTNGAHGNFTSEQAVTKLLEGTRLQVKTDSTGAMIITTPGTAEAQTATEPTKEDTQKKSNWDPFHVAQVDQGDRDSLSNSDSGPAIRLEEVVVTASKRAEEIGQVGGAVSAISGDTLAERSSDSLQDYVAFIPGLSLQSQGAAGNGVVTIRGIAPQGAGATVATYIDEAPIGASGNTTESAFFTADLDPSDLERVEVLKGPQGTLYGASSMGGVIKYVTRAPSLTTTQITTSEDFNTLDNGGAGVKVHGSVSTPLIDGVLGVRASAYYRHDGGYIDDVGYGGNGQGRDDNRGGRLSLLYQPLEDLSIRLNATIQQSNTIGLTVQDTDVFTGIPVYGPLKEKRYEPEGLDEATRLYSAEINYRMGPVDLISATSYSEILPKGLGDDTLPFQVYGDGPVSPQNPAVDQSYNNAKKLTEEVRVVSDRMGIAEWMVGGFFQDEHDHFILLDTLTNTPEANFATREGDGTLKEYAGYVNGTLYFSPRFDVTAGYRHSSISQDLSGYRTGSLFNPANPNAITTNGQSFSEGPSTYLAAARYHFSDDVLAYVRAASGYRPGGGRTLPPGAPTDWVNYYTSDKLWSYEGGVKVKGLQGRFTTDFDLFWINWSNLQSFLPIPNTPFITTGNAGTAISRGAELSTAYLPIRGLTLGLSAAFIDAHFTQTVPGIVENGQTLTYIPKLSGAAYGEYAWPLQGGWNGLVAGDYQYQGNRLDTYRVYLPAYSLWGAHAGVRNDRWQFTLYVKNLTNKEVPVGTNGSGGFPLPEYYVMQRPRLVGVTFTQKF